MTDKNFYNSMLKNISAEILALLIIGVLFILVGSSAERIHTLFVSFIGISETSGLATFLSNQLDGAVSIGWLLIIGAICFYGVRQFIDRFWKKYINPAMDMHIKTLSDALDDMRDRTHRLLSASKLDQVIENSSPEELKQRLRAVHKRVFGAHCASDRGLYAAVEKAVGAFFDPKKPHRSDYNQTITIFDNGNKTITWNEVTTYKLHTVCKDCDYTENVNDEDKIPYTVNYATTAKFDFQNQLGPQPRLELWLDDTLIYDSAAHLQFDQASNSYSDTSGEDVEISRSGDNLKIRVKKDIEITKKWVSIKIKETSIIQDDFYVSRRNEPTCGARINVNLPTGWSFDHIAFGNPDDWSIHQHPENILAAHTSSWVLPGLMCSIYWSGK